MPPKPPPKPAEGIAHLFHPSRIVTKGGVPHIRPRKQTGGRQVMATRTVRDFASNFSIDPRDPHSVIPLIRSVQRLRPEVVSVEDLGDLYAKRTAEDILHSHRVVVLSRGDRRRNKEVAGCLDNALALVAALRAHGIKADFARLGNSSLVIFKMAGKEWSVNPAIYSRRSIPNELTDIDLAGHAAFGRKGLFARGKDSWDIGIRSIDDFGKYSGASQSVPPLIDFSPEKT